VCVESAAKAWTLVEAGFTFDEIIYFADPVAEALLRAAAVDPEADPGSTDLAGLDLSAIDWAA
jgi:hypothetical protein